MRYWCISRCTSFHPKLVYVNVEVRRSILLRSVADVHWKISRFILRKGDTKVSEHVWYYLLTLACRAHYGMQHKNISAWSRTSIKQTYSWISTGRSCRKCRYEISMYWPTYGRSVQPNWQECDTVMGWNWTENSNVLWLQWCFWWIRNWMQWLKKVVFFLSTNAAMAWLHFVAKRRNEEGIGCADYPMCQQ